MEESHYTRDLLLMGIRSKRNELINLAVEGRSPSEAESYRRRAQQCLADLNDAAESLARITVVLPDTSNPAWKYVDCEDPIDPVFEYLRELNAPATENQIVEAVLAGGYRRSKSDTESNLHTSINVHLNGKAKGKVIKKTGDLISLLPGAAEYLKREKGRSQKRRRSKQVKAVESGG